MTTEKIEVFWEDATAEDVAGMMAGKTVEARFQDTGTDTDYWQEYPLAGWALRSFGVRWIDSDGVQWDRCQVYREPSWHVNKPDPGPGYRLLGKFPDEPKLATDQAWNLDIQEWRVTSIDDGIQVEEVWYRRRIEAVEPKFFVGQTVRVIGPKERPATNWMEAMDKHIEQVYTVVLVQSYPKHPSGTTDFYSVKGVSNCCFREDYLEPVEPEPKHYVLRVGDTIENPNGDRIKVVNPGFEQSHYALKVGDTVSTPNGQTITITKKGFEVTQ
jgi:hypothetical protein